MIIFKEYIITKYQLKILHQKVKLRKRLKNIKMIVILLQRQEIKNQDRLGTN